MMVSATMCILMCMYTNVYVYLVLGLQESTYNMPMPEELNKENGSKDNKVLKDLSAAGTKVSYVCLAMLCDIVMC